MFVFDHADKSPEEVRLIFICFNFILESVTTARLVERVTLNITN